MFTATLGKKTMLKALSPVGRPSLRQVLVPRRRGSWKIGVFQNAQVYYAERKMRFPFSFGWYFVWKMANATHRWPFTLTTKRTKCLSMKRAMPRVFGYRSQ